MKGILLENKTLFYDFVCINKTFTQSIPVVNKLAITKNNIFDVYYPGIKQSTSTAAMGLL